ncbi:MAG: zinc ribbon domain-containing protein YjdM [Solirubrobacteraceae bacterium]
MTDTDPGPHCPECSSEHTYELGGFQVCSMCAHEWTPATEGPTDPDGATPVVRDAVGNVLADGDTVVVVKTLKVKGGSAPIKAGTKVRNIRLVDGVGDHDIDCRIDGFGAMQLKSSVVKKA